MTLTFAATDTPPGERLRLCMLTAWLRKLCKAHGIYYPKLPYYQRFEWGSTGVERGHFHLVIAGLPPKTICSAGCQQAEALWIRQGGGFARVTIYNPSRDGVGYLLKLPAPVRGAPKIEDDSYFPMPLEAVFRILRRSTKPPV